MKSVTFFVILLIGGSLSKYNGPTTLAGLNLIKKFEGFYPNFYIDPVGIRTIGYGHACSVWNCAVPLNGKYSVPLTLATADALLHEDLAYPGSYEQCVATIVTYADLNSNQYSALVSFVFNLGCGSLLMSTLLMKLNSGDVTGAADEFPKWIHGGGGKVIPGLVKRRAAERDLFCTGKVCGGKPTDCIGEPWQDVKVMSAPELSSTVMGVLQQGSRVTLLARVDGIDEHPIRWFQIKSGTDGSKHYIPVFFTNIVKSNGEPWCTIDETNSIYR